MRSLILLLLCLPLSAQQLPDLYTQETHGDPPYLYQPGWKPLLNGRDLAGWQSLSGKPHAWTTTPAVTWRRIFDPKRLNFTPGPGDRIINGRDGVTLDISTVEKFGDCELYLEYMLAQGSNSGVFLNGEYEVQLFDSFGHQGVLQPGDNGGIYRLFDGSGGWPPSANVSRPPGAWQSLHVYFRAPRFENGRKTQNAKFLRVFLNETLIHQNVELAGPTGSRRNTDEVPAGPIVFQGDHGPVAYRSIYIRPAKFD